MAAAAAGTGNNAAPNRSTMVQTYASKYVEEGDALEGDYQLLYRRYEPTYTVAQVEEHVIGSSLIIPKVYLFLSSVDDKPIISAFHRPSTYQAHPIRTSQWDGQSFVFSGDVMAGNHITMARFPEGIFDTVEPQRVPTIAAMDSLIGALPPGANYFPGPQEGAADTELITRDMLSLYHRRTCQWYSRDTRHQGSTGWNWLVLSGTTTDRTNGRHSKSDTQLNYIRQSKELSPRQSNWTRTQWTLYCLPHISTGETSTLWISYQLTPYHQCHFAQFATTQDGPTSPVNSLQHHSEWQPQCCPT